MADQVSACQKNPVVMLEDKLEALRTEFTRDASPEARAAVQRAIEELIASKQAERAVMAGEVAPRFALKDGSGRLIDSRDLLIRGPLVVVFYRGLWCAYCSADLEAIESVSQTVREMGASLVAISHQTVSDSRKSARALHLSFPLLSDTTGAVTDAYRLRWTIPDYLREAHTCLGADVSKFNGRTGWTLPMPARYVIAPDGVVAYAEVDADYTRRPEPSDLLPVLRLLQDRPRSLWL